MSGPGFTPGPWNADVCNDWAVWKTGDCKVATTQDQRQATWYREPSKEERVANAHLIAAAPDLYGASAEALDASEKLIADLLEDDTAAHAQRVAVLELVASQLRTALAKARGEA